MFKKKITDLPPRPTMFKRFSFEVVEESDGQITLINPQCDELNVFIVEALMRGLVNATKEYNEEIKEKENKYINQ